MAGKCAPTEAVVIGKVEGDEEVKASALAAAAGFSEGGEAPAVAAGAGPSDLGKAPAAADSTAAAAAGGDEASKEAGAKLVEMPESHVRWVLAQELRPVFTLDDYSVTTDMYPQEFLDEKRELMLSIRESLLASQEEFSKYQAWVREEFEKQGRVMIPEDVNPPISEAQRELNRLSLQEEIDSLFEQGAAEFRRDHPELTALIAEVEAMTEDELLGCTAEVDGKTEDGDGIVGTADSICD